MIVFIDGENFRQRLVELLEDQEVIVDKNDIFDYDVAGLFQDILSREDLSLNYYASEIRPPKGYTPSEHIIKQFTKIKERTRYWAARLTGQGINYIKAGNLKVKEGKPCPHCNGQIEHLQEKGVDVRIALDILESSLKGENTKIIVVSSDTDLCPAYHKVKDRGVKIGYVCFADSVNRAVAAVADETITITPEKAVQYFIAEKRPTKKSKKSPKKA